MMDIKTLQEALKAEGRYDGPIDGIAGRGTRGGVTAALEAQSKQLPRGWEGWSPERRQIAYSQLVMRFAGIEVGSIDGLRGPQTDYAFEVYQSIQITGKPPDDWRKNVVPPKDPAPAPARAWPRQREVSKFYGGIGKNMVRARLAYLMRVAWNLDETVNSFLCHRKCKESFETIFERTLDHYGIDEIKRLRLDLYGGCYNPRKVRGGTAWSMHAWAIAFDIDPARNKYRWGRDRASLDNAPYEPFWDFVEAEGAISLGRVRNFDWMHFQFARL